MSNQFLNDFGKLVIYHKKESKALAQANIFLPPSSSQSKWGRVFVVANLLLDKEKDVEILNEIIEQFKDDYYASTFSDLEKTFEKALHNFNQRLSQLIHQHNLTWLNQGNFIIGVVKGNMVHFSQKGDIQAYLLRRGMFMDIVSSLGDNDNNERTNQTMSHLISGDLKLDDSLLFCTQNLFDYLSQEKIKKFINQYTANQALELIKKSLIEINKQISFAALVIKHQPLPQTEEIFDKNENPQTASMKKLIHKQQKTSDILHPGFINNFVKPKIYKFLNQFAQSQVIKNFYSQIKNLIQKISYPKCLKKFKRIAWLDKIKTNNFFQHKFSWSYLTLIFQPKKIIHQLQNKKLKLKTSPQTSKISLYITLGLALIFIVSLIWLGTNRSSNNVDFENIIQQIEEKQNIAVSAMIYDEEKARLRLEEVDQILNELPEKLPRKYRDQIQTLSEKNAEQLNQLRHLVIIDQPTEIIDLWATDPSLDKNNKIVFNAGQLYTWQPENYKIYQINLTDNKINQVGQANYNFNLGITDNNRLLFYNDKKLNQFDSTNQQLNQLDFNADILSDQIQDIGYYQNKIYLLDPGQKQIFKFYKTDTGYGNGQAWLKDDIDLSTAVSLAIDGAIYILNNQNQIIKIYTGQIENNFKTNIKPDLIQATKIYTQENWNNIYLLDPDSQRLIVLDKAGRLKKQYTSNKFDNLKDFAVDEKNNKIYLLNGSKIYQIENK
ncbi:MAG: hypothetical protein PHS07_01645 [Patescibacteria group bacterium]|nr:hypothetical protein [Patescibacteria group bacterium]